MICLRRGSKTGTMPEAREVGSHKFSLGKLCVTEPLRPHATLSTMRSRLFWDDGKYTPRPQLTGIHGARYLIVGAGIAGLSSAYFLIQHGVRPRDILIIERDTVGGGSTGHSAGMLTAEVETVDKLSWDQLAVRYGDDAARAFREQLLEAQRFIRRLIRIGKIECDFAMQDFFVLGKSPDAVKDLKREADRLRSFGEKVHMLRGSYLARELGVTGFTHAERTVPGISVNPLTFIRGFATYLEKKGVRIHERSVFLKASRGVATLKRATVKYETLVRTTGINTPDRSIQKFVTTIGVTEKLSQAKLRALKIDDLDMFVGEHGRHSFHYAKVTGDNRLLLGYGDVHVHADTASAKLHMPHVRDIRRYLKRVFPQTPMNLEYAWSAGYALSKHSFPLVKVSKREIVVNGAGVQLGTVAAAEYAVAKHFGKAHPLDVVYQRRA